MEKTSSKSLWKTRIYHNDMYKLMTVVINDEIKLQLQLETETNLNMQTKPNMSGRKLLNHLWPSGNKAKQWHCPLTTPSIGLWPSSN